MIIVGAGLAGLIAGYIFPNASIIEQRLEPFADHRALLRFRSDAVSLITGIPFRKVRVHKGIWYNGKFQQPDIRLANEYSHKVLGAFLNRSIWDLSSVDRFVAPDDLYAQMVEHHKSRLLFDHPLNGMVRRLNEPFISTIPLGAAADHWLEDAPEVEFKRAAIFVQRYKLHGADVHQTVYVPNRDTSTYRASITGDLMIVESMDEERALSWANVASMFGMQTAFATQVAAGIQAYGKIAPIDERIRKETIHRLSIERNVFSVGRFATWRNILLDDVVHDLRVVKGMIEQNSAYDKKIRSV